MSISGEDGSKEGGRKIDIALDLEEVEEVSEIAGEAARYSHCASDIICACIRSFVRSDE